MQLEDTNRKWQLRVVNPVSLGRELDTYSSTGSSQSNLLVSQRKRKLDRQVVNPRQIQEIMLLTTGVQIFCHRFNVPANCSMPCMNFSSLYIHHYGLSLIRDINQDKESDKRFEPTFLGHD